MFRGKSNIKSDVFALKPIRAAKVSEISEATAASPVDSKDRINFHIGNPVQNELLSLKYLKLVLGLPPDYKLSHFDIERLLAHLGWDKTDDIYLNWLYKTIKSSSPYMPRGGFNRRNPNLLIKYFREWLTKNPTDPLQYDLGEKSGKRECTIASGGIDEVIRILLTSLSNYSLAIKVNIVAYNYEVPSYLQQNEDVIIHRIIGEEFVMLDQLEQIISSEINTANYLIINSILSEETRRTLRKLALNTSLFFIELNNAGNSYSLAREAGLSDKVMRIITPEVFHEKLENNSVTFLAGPSEFIKVFETVHFQLKGTPGAAEVELLHFLIESKFEQLREDQDSNELSFPSYNEPSKYSFDELFTSGSQFTTTLEMIAARQSAKLNKISSRIAGKVTDFSKKYTCAVDSFQSDLPLELVKKLVARPGEELFTSHLQRNFLTVFASTHKMYDSGDLILVSGSSRTALGIIGFRCGIKEVVCADLSWTYEHCFPSVTAVPLTDNFELDVPGIIKAAIERCAISDNKVAVALNNPHNATGQIFEEKSLKRLITQLVRNNIYVIDDLAYQNVAPMEKVEFCKTIKQLALELVDEGKISRHSLSKIITVHSLSKTDCFAGARLSVVEMSDKRLRAIFSEVNNRIKPNSAAVMLAYLFYRNDNTAKMNYWLSRNSIMHKKMEAVKTAIDNIPDDRNRFVIEIKTPQGSMYPQMIINNLPDGLSLDWLASNLARQGTGVVPLSTFARTSKGYSLGRKAFRLTLGGSDTPEAILSKTRRMLIDLNRIIADQTAKYNKIVPTRFINKFANESEYKKVESLWSNIQVAIIDNCTKILKRSLTESLKQENEKELIKNFKDVYLPKRLSELKHIFSDQVLTTKEHLASIRENGFRSLQERLEKEFFKDDLDLRRERFKARSYDRTVHPTQVYSLEVERQLNKIADNYLFDNEIRDERFRKFSNVMVKEYIGSNVAINSIGEAEELKLDFRSLLIAEIYTELNSNNKLDTFLSFWGDWDGSSRPSGQGHRLVASALLENVTELSGILLTLTNCDSTIKLDKGLTEEIENLHSVNESFWNLLNEITSLTNQLEKRYRSVLPYSISSSGARKLGMKLGIASDPLTKLWQHNDRLEQRMNAMRAKRRDQLEYYFRLNKTLRKTLYQNIPVIIKNLNNDRLLLKVATYRDILKRFALTPRIHQKLITANDQFAINTTVYNLTEINELAGKYGNPGMVLGLQVSMSTTPDALMSLERKLYAEKQRVLSTGSTSQLPDVWCIPLFEDVANVNGIEEYLDRMWEFAKQTGAVDEPAEARLTNIMCEVFIAGSDLSQQIGQTASWHEYKKAKHGIIKWLAKKGITDKVRLKLGSGEPMQRQGGYYSEISGKHAFINSGSNSAKLNRHLKESTTASTKFAKTPLHGVMARADLQTFQSNISEKIRNLPVKKRSEFLYHVQKAQENHRDEILAAAEPFVNTRLHFESKGAQELKRLTIGHVDDVYESFVELTKNNFKKILYGTDADVVGIHLISYFISRTTPTLRDRPTVRPSSNLGNDKGQKILERIASTIPLSKHGSLLRAIGHNRAQSVILGVNQLTTGMFRAFKEFSQMEFDNGLGSNLLMDKILPNLPVYEILNTLRNYTDIDLKYIGRLAKSFPPGLVSLSLLREDVKAIQEFVPFLQKELLRRHGLNVSEFFVNNQFVPELLQTVRPDLAVILQNDIFNTDIDKLPEVITGDTSAEWKNEFIDLISLPNHIKLIRSKIWNLLEGPVSMQVKSFSELAIALNTLSNEIGGSEFASSSKKLQNTRFETTLTDLLKGKVDDSMRQFLSAAVHYLTRLPDEVVEVPIDIVRALKEVERILRIDEQALNKTDQQKLNFYTLQIARLVGENG